MTPKLQEWVDHYDRQIEAILSGNITEMERLLQTSNLVAPYKKGNVAHHLWNSTATNHLSLFASLPGCSHCASALEVEALTSSPDLCDREIEMLNTIIQPGYIPLPDLRSEYDWEPTREQLHEFKRRQLLARFNHDIGGYSHG